MRALSLSFEAPRYLAMHSREPKIIIKEGESLKRPTQIGCSDRGPDRRQVGNIATPSNERDRLSYLHCRIYKLTRPVHAHEVNTRAYPSLYEEGGTW